MRTLALLIAMNVCAPPKMVNKTKYPWNDNDRAAMSTCIKHCPKYTGQPCLKTFEKWEEHGYHCWCGR